MTKSMMLLEEALTELHHLATEARSTNSLLYEGMGYTPFQVVLLEAEAEATAGTEKKEKGPGFLKRAGDSIKKLTAAADSAIEELEAMRDQMQEFGFGATTDAISRAINDLKKKKPGTGFLSKIGAGGNMAVRALFGKEDDPAEAVAEIVTDANAFQKIFSGVIKAVMAQLQKIDVAKVVDETTGESAERTPEEQKQYIDKLQAKMMSTTLNDMANNPDWEEFRTGSGFDEDTVKSAVSDNVKPAEGMFSGIRSLGASLGIGLGGDVPFKKYYGMNSGQALIDDIMLLTPTQLQSFMKKGTDVGDTSDMQNVKAGLEGLNTAKENMPDKPTTQSGTGSRSTERTRTSDGDDDVTSKLLGVLKGAGIKEPDVAKQKFAQLIGMELPAARPAANESVVGLTQFSLYSLLQEKAVRYEDVIAALGDHLPDDENEQAAAVRKLADEMKVALGTEYDIVGMPDIGGKERDALRAEIQALRDAITQIEDPDAREQAIQAASDNLTDQGVDADVADDIADPSAPLAQVLDDVAETGDVDDVVDAIPDNDVSEFLIDDSSEEDVKSGDVYMYTSNKGKSFPIKIKELSSNPGYAVALRLNSAGDGWSNNEFSAKIISLDDKISEKEAFKKASTKKKKTKRDPGTYWKLPAGRKGGKKWGAKKKSGGKAAEFAKEESAKKHSLKEHLARIAVARMRGWLLYEIGDFKQVSSMVSSDIITEFYSRGGNNKDIKDMKFSKDRSALKKWSILAGIKR